jgi:hypothetical protein
MIRQVADSLPSQPAPTPPPADVADMLGRYFGDGLVLSLTWQGGRLLAQWAPRKGLAQEPPMELVPEGRDTLRFAGYGSYRSYVGELIHVQRDAVGTVRGFEICGYPYRRV